ncbi:hypothetical protein L0128_08805 [candidate division KSB1 bacterium]|nr:hypothetical protein [candidate division KSB1 bacterium]
MLVIHYDLARELAWLRADGVQMIGSGNIVHNLRRVDFENPDAAPPAWALEFDAAVKRVLLENQHHALINYPDWGQPAQLAVPTSEHFLPLL